MGKKILKRSLALGALMAFVITGNAWAEGETIGAGTDAYKINEHQSVTGEKSFYNTEFKDCEFNAGNGGAITMSTNSDLEIENCTFINNRVLEIINDGGGKSTPKGGHISNDAGTLIIKNSLFKDGLLGEEDQGYGHSIFSVNGASTEIYNSVFRDNVGKSGIIYLESGSQLSLTNVKFLENINYSSCVHLPSSTNGTTVYIYGENNEFRDNYSQCFCDLSGNNIIFAAGSITTMVGNANDITSNGTVLIANSAKLISDGGIYCNGRFVLNGTLEILGDGEISSVIKTLDGTGGTLYFKDKASLTVTTNNCSPTDLTLYATKGAVRAVNNDVNELIKYIDFNDYTEIKITDAITTETAKVINYNDKFGIDAPGYDEKREGNMYVDYTDPDNFKETLNPENQAVGDKGVALKLHWRSHLSDMNKRMGELRDTHGELGVWTRMVRGENEYKGTKAQYNQYQLGYDERLSVDKRWIVGTAITFAEGDASYGYGSTDDKSTAFTVYGTKLNSDGSYVDLIARYEHMESDLKDAVSGSGDYCANGMSVSAEAGKRFKQNDGVWIEPQVQLTYGTVDSAEFQLGGKTVQVGDMDSLIGRIGFRIGQDIEQGNVYARASYLYDFDGKTEATFSNANTSRTIKEDLGGGWWEVGVGTNINLSKATYLYAEVDKTFGGEVDTNWQWNLGVRYSF